MATDNNNNGSPATRRNNGRFRVVSYQQPTRYTYVSCFGEDPDGGVFYHSLAVAVERPDLFGLQEILNY